LTQSPSGTRLGFSAVDEAIGFRVFLNQAIWDCIYAVTSSKVKNRSTPNLQLPTSKQAGSSELAWGLVVGELGV